MDGTTLSARILKIQELLGEQTPIEFRQAWYSGCAPSDVAAGRSLYGHSLAYAVDSGGAALAYGIVVDGFRFGAQGRSYDEAARRSLGQVLDWLRREGKRGKSDCPNCELPGPIPQGDGFYRCRHCQAYYRWADADQPLILDESPVADEEFDYLPAKPDEAELLPAGDLA